MRKILFSFLIFVFPATAFSQLPDSVYAKWLLTPEIKKGFDFSLSAAKLTYQDFTLRPDYWEIDPARMNEINQLITYPLRLPTKSLEIAEQVRGQNAFNNFTPFINNTGLYDMLLLPRSDFIAYQYIRPKAERLMSRSRSFPSNIPSKDPVLFKRSFFTLLATLPEEGFVAAYTEKEMDFIQNKFPRTILEDTVEEKLSVDELDSIQKLEEKLTREFAPLVNASRDHIMNVNIALSFLRSFREASNLMGTFVPSSGKVANEILWEDKKRHVIIGGTGPNHYKGDYALIIDLGGDDTYELTRRPNFTGQVIIDLGGNDKYFALEDYVLACGYFGYSVLIDVAGDDLYQGKNFSLGCGFFGCGLLWDQAGSDTYIGDQFTQGAGGFGIGILKDDGGNDRYQAALYAQGFGFVRGVGALLDANGNDNYFAGGKYKELLGLAGEIRYQSMSQGCAYGLKPYLSGGMGFLFDYDGDDQYSVDMFGQGSSYWWGLGALVDFKGNDRYIAQQYAQGAGVHMSLGVLVDSSGNDFYLSKGVSQGSGHDFGAGMLFDLSGNDNYVAESGSQAYGSANGYGIFVDGAGNDGYYVKNRTNTQGAGNPRREYGSIGLFLDCAGTDHYDGRGGDNRFWKPIAPNNMWGIGVDGNFGAADSAQVKK